LSEIVRKATRERKFIKRVNPVRPQIVELPIRVDIGLLHGVVSSHALVQRDHIRSHLREVIGRAWKAGIPPIYGENISLHVVACAHFLEDLGIGVGNRPELRMAVPARRGGGWDCDVVDHPAFIPAALVVDHEHWGDVGKDIDESARIVGIGR
jgi:hypothetical protein